MKQKISSTDRAACAGAPSLRARGSGEARNAEKTARGGQTVPPGHIFGWARGSIGRGRIARGGAPSGKGGVVRRSTKFTTGEGVARTDDGRPGRVGDAETILERRYGDAGGARGALAEDDTSSRPAKRAHARVSGADARRCFLLRRFVAHARPSSDPRPPDSRAPSSSFSSPTAAVGAEHGTSRGASREFRVSRSIAAPRAASPPHPRTPSADAHIFKDEDRTCANASSFS